MIRVAGYCRVSTDKDDQANSFEAQQRFFRDYISHHPDWELHEIYADSGITGTSTKKRAQFNRMIRDAYEKKFQLIVTKEVSRFSRNILDTISFTRELKALGIGVVFMSDGFSTLDSDAELRLSIIGSIAQEESRKTSSRVKWGQTRQMERGVVFGRSMLGYEVKNGALTVEPEGAKIVRHIFRQYGLEKKGTTVIARELREAGYRTYSGNALWSESHILKILKNEKYVGDLVQKKTITPDYLTHSKKYNHGEEDLIIIRDHHEPIISRALWDLAQGEIQKRRRGKDTSSAHSNRYIFSGKIICGQCGARFVSRVKRRKDGTSCRRWGCYNAVRYGKQKTDSQGNGIGCDVGMQIPDDLALEMATYVMGQLPLDTDTVIRNMVDLLSHVVENGKDSGKVREKIEKLRNKRLKAIDSFLSGDITKEELDGIRLRYDSELERMESGPQIPAVNLEKIGEILDEIISCRQISEPFLKMMIDQVVVRQDGTVELKLKLLPTVWSFKLYRG